MTTFTFSLRIERQRELLYQSIAKRWPRKLAAGPGGCRAGRSFRLARPSAMVSGVLPCSFKEPLVPETASRGPFRRFVNRLEVDQAVFYSLCLRVWQLLAGPVSMLMIGRFFSPGMQGYYYTFSSLIALQAFFELSLYIAVINVASHEWSQLHLDAGGRIAGEPAAVSRLVSLGRLLCVWYGVAAILFALGVGFGGAWFLAEKEAGAIAWQMPWIALTVFSAGSLWAWPFLVLLEGCGQIAVVNRYRVFQVISGNAIVWTCMYLGLGLWAAVAASATQLAWGLILIGGRYRRFFQAFWSAPTGPRLQWQSELWPLQWRLAIGAVGSYFAFNLFTPVMYRYHDPAVAGQMGMTWQLVTMLQGGALAWVQTRTPLFGRLVATRDYRELDRVFFRLTWISWSVAGAGALGLWLLVWGLSWTDFRLAARLLPPQPTALFLAAAFLYHFPNCQAFYIRAHKREPLLAVSICSSSLIGVSVWWCGRWYGPLGAAWAFLTVVAVVVFPWQTWIWWQCRAEQKR